MFFFGSHRQDYWIFPAWDESLICDIRRILSVFTCFFFFFLFTSETQTRQVAVNATFTKAPPKKEEEEEDWVFQLRWRCSVCHAHLSPFDRLFWCFLPLGLRSLPTQWMPPGPVTRWDSRPLDDFLKVNSTASPSFRLRKPSMCNLLWKKTKNKERLSV